MPDSSPHLVYIVSSHGFGHASRACAVLGALARLRLRPLLRVTVVGETPQWFFDDSLAGCGGLELRYRHAATDVGLSQRDALVEDLDATARRLEQWWPGGPASPLDGERLAPLLEAVAGARLVVCDISPFGLAAAYRAGVPSLLVENFTWDWIYRGYGADGDGDSLAPWTAPMAGLFAKATHRVQTTPVCHPLVHATTVAPVARAPRHPRAEIRRRLSVPDDEPMVLVTMGGIEWDYAELEAELGDPRLPWLVIPGSCPRPRRHGRCIRLPHRSTFYHPDLVHAADAVVGKLGYSTLAEVWSAGIPLGYVPRARFPESPPLEAWVEAEMPHRAIEPERFVDGGWLEALGPLLALSATPPRDPLEGARAVAREIATRLELD